MANILNDQRLGKITASDAAQKLSVLSQQEASQKILTDTKVQSAAQMQQKEKFKLGQANTLLWWGVALIIAAGGMLFLKFCKI